MDVRAKQRLCYRGVFLLSAGLVAVSPHVNSAVRIEIALCSSGIQSIFSSR